MSWKRSLLELVIRAVSVTAPSRLEPPEDPPSIFVLRNNDLGDLLAITPLFEALRRRFPQARIVAGVGPWGEPLLENNPHVDEVIPLRAPWHNKYIQRQGWWQALRYIFFSAETGALAARRFDIGLDILGSPVGSLLLMRARIPFRVGVRGYAGGHGATQRHHCFDPAEHVGRAALRMAQLLGATSLPENKPQLFLSPAEIESAEELWKIREAGQERQRLILAPGAGLPEKRWSEAKWQLLVQRLASDARWQLFLVGSDEDRVLCDRLSALDPAIVSLAGRHALRQTLALVSRADAVVCHSSMILHAAAAWEIPTLVLLGPMFSSPEQHAQQWGYARCVMLGAAQPEEAVNVLTRLCFDARDPTDRSDRLEYPVRIGVH